MSKFIEIKAFNCENIFAVTEKGRMMMHRYFYDDTVEVRMPKKLAIKLKHILTQNSDADIEDVVRCKDCKRCYEKRTKRNNQLMRFCMRMDGNEYQVNANDFCNYGEKR